MSGLTPEDIKIMREKSLMLSQNLQNSPDENNLPVDTYRRAQLLREQNILSTPTSTPVGDFFEQAGRSKFDEGTPAQSVFEPYGIQDWRGEQQSRWDKLIHAPIRLSTSIPLKLTQMVGYMGGAVGWAATGDINEMTQNPLSVFAHKVEDTIKEYVPIYKPGHLRDANLLQNLWSSSFWADEAVDAVAFFAGAAALGYATGGLAPYLHSIGISANISKNIGLAIATGAQTLGEAGMEAGMSQKEMFQRRDAELDNYASKLQMQGYNPIQIEEALMIRKNELDTAINDAARGIFQTNVAILILPNLFMNRMLFGKMFDTDKSIVSRALGEAGLQKAAPIAGREAAKKIAGNVLKGIGSEGFWEEGVQDTATRYFEALAFGETDKEFLEGMVTTYFESLGDVDFQKAIFLGGLLGGLGGFKGARSEIASSNKQIANLNKIIDRYSDGKNTPIINRTNFNASDPSTYSDAFIDALTRIHTTAQILKNSTFQDLAQLSNKEELVEFIENATLLNWALPLLSMKDGIKVAEKLLDKMTQDAETDASKDSSNTKDKTDFQRHKQQLIEKLKTFQNVYDTVNNKYGGMLYYLPNNSTLTKKQFDTVKSSYIQTVIAAQIGTEANRKYINERILQLTNKLSTIGNTGVDADTREKLEKDLKELTSIESKLQEDYKELTNKDKLFTLFDAHVKAHEKVIKIAEDNKKKSTKEVVEQTNIAPQFKDAFNTGVFTETLSIEGKDKKKTHKGQVIFSTESKSESGDIVISDSESLTINGITNDGNLELEDNKGNSIRLLPDGRIQYIKDGKWYESGNKKWTNLRVSKTGEEARNEAHRDVFRQAIEKEYSGILDIIETNRNEISEINKSLVELEKSISRALANKSSKAKYTQVGVSAKIGLIKAVEEGKAIMATIHQLEGAKELLISLKTAHKAQVDTNIAKIEEVVANFEKDAYEEATKQLSEEKDNVEKIIDKTNSLISKIEKRIGNLKKAISQRISLINNYLKKRKAINTTSNDLEELGRILENVSDIDSDIDGARAILATMRNSQLEAEAELESLEAELPSLILEYNELKELVDKRNRILASYYKLIQQDWFIAKEVKQTTNTESVDTQIESSIVKGEEDFIPLHPFTGSYSNLMYTTVNQEDFIKDPLTFEPQLAFQRVIDEYDINSGDYSLRIVSTTTLKQILQDQGLWDNLSPEAIANFENQIITNPRAAWTLLYNTDTRTLVVEDSVMQEGKQIPLYGVVGEARQVDGKWVNERVGSGKELVASDKYEGDFDIAFDAAYKAYNDFITDTINLDSNQAESNEFALFPIGEKTQGTIGKEKNADGKLVIPSSKSVVGTIVENESQIDDIDTKLGTGVTEDIGGKSMEVPAGFIRINYKDRLVSTDRAKLSPEHVDAVTNLLRMYLFHFNDVTTREDVENILHLIIYFKYKDRSKTSDYSIFAKLDKNGKLEGISFGKKGFISVNELLTNNPSDNLEALQKFLATKIYNIDKDSLASNDEYTEYSANILYTADGKISSAEFRRLRNWDSYKKYLMSSDNTTPKITVKLNPIPKNKPEAMERPQFVNRSFHITTKINRVVDENPRGKETSTATTAPVQGEKLSNYLVSGLNNKGFTQTQVNTLTDATAKALLRLTTKAAKEKGSPLTKEELNALYSSAVSQKTSTTSAATTTEPKTDVAPETTALLDSIRGLVDNPPSAPETPVQEASPVKTEIKKDELIDDNEIDGIDFNLSTPVAHTELTSVQDDIEALRQQFKGLNIALPDWSLDVQARVRVLNGKLTLFTRPFIAEKGLFHEVFHIVELAFMTSEERSKFYNEARKRLGNKIVVIEGVEVVGKDMTDSQASEFLAEEYRDFIITGANNYGFSKAHGQKESFIDKVFRKFNQVIDLLLRRAGIRTSATPFGIESLFNEISTTTYDMPEIVNVEDVTKNRIGNLPSDVSTAIVDHIHYKFFDLIHNDSEFKGIGVKEITSPAIRNKLFNKIVKEIRDKAVQENNSLLASLVKKDESGGLPIKEAITLFQKRLADWQMKVKEIKQIAEENNESLADVEIPTQFIESVYIDVRDHVSTEVKFLIAGLPKLVNTEKGVAIASRLGLEAPVSYSYVINMLHKHLANISTFDEMVERLQELSAKFPHYITLLDRLGVSPGNNYSKQSREYHSLRVSFFNQFSKSQKEFLLGILNEDGMYFMEGMTDVVEKSTFEEWQNKIAATPSGLYTKDKGKHKINLNHKFKVEGKNISLNEYIGKSHLFRKLTPNKQKFVDFLSNFGISIPAEFLTEPNSLKLLADTVGFFLDNADQVLKTPDRVKSKTLYMEDFFDSTTIKINKELKELAVKLSDYSEKSGLNQRRAADGTTKYNVNLPTHIDRVLGQLRKSIPKHILPFDQGGLNFGTIGSRWINKIRKDKSTIETVVLDAMGEERGIKTDTNELKQADFVIFEINAVLNGKLPFMRSANRSIETAFNLGQSYIKLQVGENDTKGNVLLGDRTYKIYKDYLKSEIVSALAHRNTPAAKHLSKYNNYLNLSFFDGLIKLPLPTTPIVESEYLQYAEELINNNSQTIKNALKEYFQGELESTMEYLLKNGVTQVTGLDSNGNKLYDARFLDRNTLQNISSRTIDPTKMAEMPEKILKEFIHLFNVEYISSSIEQTKLFTGDIKQFSKKVSNELHKRTNLHTSTVEATLNDPEFVEELNKYSPRIDGTKHDDRIRSIAKKDLKVRSKLVGILNKISPAAARVYESMTEADAGSWFTLDGFHSFLSRSGNLTPAKEATILYQKQFFFQYMMKERSKVAPKIFNKKNYERIFAEHLPDNYSMDKMYYLKQELDYAELAPLERAKPQGVGQILNAPLIGLNKQISHKLSAGMYMPTDIVGTNLMEDLIEATLLKVDLVNPVSAQKHESLGNNKGELVEYYDENGNPIKLSKVFGIKDENYWIQEQDWRHIGNQMDIDPSGKSKITMSVQTRRLITVDIMNKGEARLPQHKDKVDKLNRLYREVVIRDLNGFLDRIGLSRNEKNQWKLTNNEKFVATVVEALSTRRQPANVEESVRFIIEQHNKFFDTLPTKRQIVNLIQGLIRNNVVKTKTSGDMLVQEPNTGYETGPREYVTAGGTRYMVSNFLKFYRPIQADGTEWLQEHLDDLNPEDIAAIAPAQVMVSFRKQWIPAVLKQLGRDKFTPEVLAEFNTKMMDPTWEYYNVWKEIRTVLGNRTPAQHLNSIEVFEVVKFLSPMSGNKIVLPSEIVAKSGSDFDIDKLNTYFNNVSIGKDGTLSLDSPMDSSLTNEQKAALIYKDKDMFTRLMLKYVETSSEGAKATLKLIDDINKGLAKAFETKEEIKESEEFVAISNKIKELDEAIKQSKGKQRDELLVERGSAVLYSKHLLEDLKIQIEDDLKLKQAIIKEIADILVPMATEEDLMTRGALENEIYKISKELALAPENYASLMSPNNSDIVDEQAAKVPNAPKETTNIGKMVSFPYNAQIAETQWGAAKLIGSIAINMTFHPLMQQYPITFNSEFVELFFGEFYGKEGVPSLGYTNNNSKDNNLISVILGNIATATVDATKHTFAPINIINLNPATVNSYMLLTMLGKGANNPIDFRFLTKFFTQPVIIDAEQAFRNNESEFKRSLGETSEKGTIARQVLKEKYNLEPKGKMLFEYAKDLLKANDLDAIQLAKAALADQIRQRKADPKYYLTAENMKSNPELVLDYHLYYLEIGKILKKLQDVTRYDAGLPKMRDAVKLRDIGIEQLKRSGIIDNASLEQVYNKSFIGAYQQAHRDTYEAFNEFDAVEHIPALKEFMWGSESVLGLMEVFLNKELAKSETDLTEIKQKLTNALISYMLHKAPLPNSTSTLSDMYSMLNSGANSVAKRFERLKDSEEKKDRKDLQFNDFFTKAVGMIQEWIVKKNKAREVDYIKFYNNKLTVEESDRLRESLEDLFNHSNSEVAKFARDLVVLSIIQSGSQISPASYFEHLPVRNYFNAVSSLLYNFTNQIIPSNGLNLRVARTIFNNLRNERKIVPKIRLNTNEWNRSKLTEFKELIIADSKTITSYDYIAVDLDLNKSGSYDTYTFEANGYGKWTKKGEPDIPYRIYRRLPQQGDGYAHFDARDIDLTAINLQHRVVPKGEMVINPTTGETSYTVPVKGYLSQPVFSATAVDTTAESYAAMGESMALDLASSKVFDGNIWDFDGVPIIPTNLGGIHGAGLANQAYKKGLLTYKKDGSFTVKSSIISFPVKKVWNNKADIKLINESADKLIQLANSNPNTVYNLPLIGLGHGEGDVSTIVPIITRILNSTNNVRLILATPTTDRGKQGTARKDRGDAVVNEVREMFGLDTSTKTITSPTTSIPVSEIQSTVETIVSKPGYVKETAKKHLPKELVKIKQATQFIGTGNGNDSTTQRMEDAYKQVETANTGQYNSNDLIYVSSNGKRINRVNPVVNGKLNSVYQNIDKAIAVGAKFIMDTKAHLDKTSIYNIGEVALAEYLTSKGYIREDATGIWSPKVTPKILQPTTDVSGTSMTQFTPVKTFKIGQKVVDEDFTVWQIISKEEWAKETRVPTLTSGIKARAITNIHPNKFQRESRLNPDSTTYIYPKGVTTLPENMLVKLYTDGMAQLDTGRRLQPNELKADKALLERLSDVWSRLGITHIAVDNIPMGNDKVSAVAVADMITKVVEYVEGKRALDTLPEETAHIALGMLPVDNKLRKAVLKNIENTPYYSEVVKQYGELYNYNVEALKFEAAGKAIADALVNQNQLDLDKSTWGVIKTQARAIINAIKDMLNIGNPYNRVAYRLLNQQFGEFMDRNATPIAPDTQFYQSEYTKRRLEVQDDIKQSTTKKWTNKEGIVHTSNRAKAVEQLLDGKEPELTEVDIAETDRVQLTQSEADMKASEEKVIEINKTELKKVQQTQIKEGVDFVFEQTPELAKIGTAQQYSRYLSTVFPKSDIFYHTTVVDFDTFNQNKTTMLSKDMGKGLYVSHKEHTGKWSEYQLQNANNIKQLLEYRWVKSTLNKLDKRLKHTHNKLIQSILSKENRHIDIAKDVYNKFTNLVSKDKYSNPYPELTKYVIDKYNIKPLDDIEILDIPKVKPILVNTSNSLTVEDGYLQSEEHKYSNYTVVIEKSKKGIEQAVIPKPNRDGLILGSKQDIQGFREFVNKDVQPGTQLELDFEGAAREEIILDQLANFSKYYGTLAETMPMESTRRQFINGVLNGEIKIDCII